MALNPPPFKPFNLDLETHLIPPQIAGLVPSSHIFRGTPCQARLPLISLTFHCVAIATIQPCEFEAINMSDRGARIAGVAIALYTLSAVAVSVRCYVRVSLVRSFGYDDWLIVATLVRLQCEAFERKRPLTGSVFIHCLLHSQPYWDSPWHGTQNCRPYCS
jgi:hypothetical protein